MEAAMRIGDVVKLKAEAAHGRRRELAGEVGKVGDVWEVDGVTHCAVVYEALQSLLWDADAADFVPADAETLH